MTRINPILETAIVKNKNIPSLWRQWPKNANFSIEFFVSKEFQKKEKKTFWNLKEKKPWVKNFWVKDDEEEENFQGHLKAMNQLMLEAQDR